VAETQRLEHLNKLGKLDQLLYYVDETPADPDPIVIPEAPTPVVIDDEGPAFGGNQNLKKTVKIIDEKVPLAKAPNTGDLSGIWAVISGLSLGGISLLNRKRKEEE
jgi:LPXTG-motif cell wall-anchored protein